MPSSVFRQAPRPLHISTARQAAVLGVVEERHRLHGAIAGPYRRLAVSGGASTILPGLRRPSGSKVRLMCRNAS